MKFQSENYQSLDFSESQISQMRDYIAAVAGRTHSISAPIAEV